MAPEPRVYLYMDDVPNIQKAMESARSHSFDRVVIRIKNLKLTDRNTGERTNAVGIRSDLLLNPERWRHNSILKINEQCDISSRHREIQLQAQRNVKREIEWANHLDQFSCVLVDLNKDELCSLSRELMNKFDKFGCVLAELPMVDKSFFSQNYANNTNKTDLTTACARVWHRWNTFRIAADFNSLFKVLSFTSHFLLFLINILHILFNIFLISDYHSSYFLFIFFSYSFFFCSMRSVSFVGGSGINASYTATM